MASNKKPLKEKETKIIKGVALQDATLHRSWITFYTPDGVKVTLSGQQLYNLFDLFNFKVESYGDHFRIVGFELVK